jgi:hypothetical protein
MIEEDRFGSGFELRAPVDLPQNKTPSARSQGRKGNWLLKTRNYNKQSALKININSTRFVVKIKLCRHD